MTKREILDKAINKAVENGWLIEKVINTDSELLDEIIETDTYYQFIFSHSFAEAFWRDYNTEDWDNMKPYKEMNVKIGDPKGDYSIGIYSRWQLHLREMVLEEEPIKYLEKFL